jgi:two-component system, cell cycle sensor histidine kinase and response regulator CckA
MPSSSLARIRTELPDQYRSWVRVAAAGAAVSYGVIGFSRLLIGPPEPWFGRSELVALAVCLLAVGLQARGRTRMAALCLVATVWLEAHWAMVLSPMGIRNGGALPLVALVAALVALLGSRMAVLATSATSVTVPAALALGHWLGFGPGFHGEDWIYCAILILSMWVCLALLNLLVGSFEMVLERAQRNAQRMRELVHGSPDAMIGISADGCVESFNPAAEQLLGLAATEAVGRPYTELPLSGPSEESGIGPRELLAERQGRTLEALFRKTTREDGGRGTLVVLRDVTQRKQAELKAQQLQQQLLHSQKLEAVGHLAGGVAHDFNNLLTAVAGYGSLVARSSDPVARELGKELLTVQERGAALTRQLLAFARKEVPQPRSTELGRLVCDTRPLLRHLLGERIELELAAAEPCPVFIDPGQVQQLLLNLAANARDAMSGGGTLRIACRSEGERVELTVSDTGTGIAPELRSRVFEPFFTTKARGQGTGLGLATVRAIVEESGGRIELVSEVDHGTTFVVWWPRSARDPEEDARGVPGAIPRRGRGSVLVAEDDAQARHVFRLALEGAGYRVTVTASGEDALGRGLVEPPDLLLSDVMLPGMTGVDLALRLRATLPELPVLFVSGYLHDVLDQAPFDPVSDLLAKPFTMDALLRRVAEKLGRAT